MSAPDRVQGLKPAAGKVYLNGDGRTVHIMGSTTGKPPATPDAFWSLEGDHYHGDTGEMVSREGAMSRALQKEVGTHSDGGKGYGWAHHVCTYCYPVVNA